MTECIYELDPCCSGCVWSRLSIVGDIDRHWIANTCQLIDISIGGYAKMMKHLRPTPVLMHHCRVMNDANAADIKVSASDENIMKIRNDYWSV